MTLSRRRGYRRVLANGLSAIAVATLVAAQPVACEPQREEGGTGVRIMPLGNSITDGFGIPGGYRIELSRRLKADGHRIDFVGSLDNGAPSLKDTDHEGHSGYRVDEIRARVEPWVKTAKPDHILLLIGTNDVTQGYAPRTVQRRLASLLDRVTAAAPTAQVFVSSIPPLASDELNDRADGYNAAIPRIVEAKRAKDQRVRFVDAGRALTTADLSDGVHPNRRGYAKLAEAWYEAVAPHLRD